MITHKETPATHAGFCYALAFDTLSARIGGESAPQWVARILDGRGILKGECVC